jgi:hypothetical protein
MISVVKGMVSSGFHLFYFSEDFTLDEYKIMPVDVTKKSVSTAARERSVLE